MGLRVLFVDDEMGILNAVARTLRNEGHALFFTTDPGAVADIVALEHIDVIVSDQMMPHQLGTDLLRVTRPQAFMQILMTGMVDESVLQKGIDEGVVDTCIRKPFEPAALRQVLRDVNDGTWLFGP